MAGYPKTLYVEAVTAPFFGRAWEERPVGYSVRYDMHNDDAQATIARMTAELELQTAMLLDAYGDSTVLDQIIKQAVDAETRACAEVCATQAETFGTEEYAVGQPLSSFSERFACSQVREAILARLDQRKEAE